MAIEAVIFDMDGLIIDSEPLWEETYVDRLAGLGVPRLEVLKPDYKGMGVRDFFKHWVDTYKWGDSPTAEDLTLESTAAMEKLILQKGTALPGVLDTIKLLKAHGLPLAVASSSPLHLIHATMERLRIRQYFDVLHTGAAEDFAKPHPAVFIHTANELGVEYPNCLVLEDSLNGVLAAKAARMKCIAVPEPANWDDPRYAIADRKLHTMSDLTLDLLEEL